MESDTFKDLQRVQRNLVFYKSAEFQDFKISVLEARSRELRMQAEYELVNGVDQITQTNVFIKLRVAAELENILRFIVSNLEQEEDLYRRDFDSPPSP